MDGNISFLDNALFVHLHTSLSDDKFQVIGGHLFNATVAVTAECWIEAFPGIEMHRESVGKNSFMPIKI
jgi:predicted DNA-binding protein with PD1-like motif